MGTENPCVSAEDVLLYAKDQVVKRLNASVLMLDSNEWNQAVMNVLNSITDEDFITIYNRYTRK